MPSLTAGNSEAIQKGGVAGARPRVDASMLTRRAKKKKPEEEEPQAPSAPTTAAMFTQKRKFRA